MRGENAAPTAATLGVSGTSPRARGKRVFPHPGSPALRNIPACAGKTPSCKSWGRPSSEHPRARGENARSPCCALSGTGTSPRTRGKQSGKPILSPTHGNIPAHAGKTEGEHGLVLKGEEHPRARGENLGRCSCVVRHQGTSPRTRGKLLTVLRAGAWARNIPAHAGKTQVGLSCAFGVGEHPRARGENDYVDKADNKLRGTSPRTRGKPYR